MATLLESGARPYGSRRGAVISMALHGALITAAVLGTSRVVLPPREKVEEHPVLYVASPPPKPIEAPPEPTKPPEKVFKAPPKAPAPRPVQAPQPRPVQPRPEVPATPALVTPVRVAVNI